MLTDDFLLGFGAGKAAGGSSVTVESLSVTTNGTYSETGKAYSPVAVNVQPVLQSKSVSITQNGTTIVSPDDGKYGLSSVEVNVSVSGGGGGGGIDYEEGTFSVAEDAQSYSVSFENNHDISPAVIVLADSTGSVVPKNGIAIWSMINPRAIWGFPIEAYPDSFMEYTQSAFGRLSTSGQWNNGFSSIYPSQIFDSAGFTFDCYSFTSRLFKAGRTYKWIAVWK